MPIPSNQITIVETSVIAQVAAGGSNSKPFAFVFHWRRTATVLAVSKAQVDTAFQSSVVVPLALALNLTWTQSNNTVRWVNDALDAPIQFSHAAVGAVTGDRMATIDAAFLLMRTGIRGKSYRGSKHFGPMSESDSTSGTDDIWNAGCLTRLGAVAAAILAGFTDAAGNIWVPSVLSRRLSQLVSNPTTVVANDVVQIAVNKRIGSMRHRHVKSVY
jgi:hypothetical protein